jgi:hypothetical protein
MTDVVDAFLCASACDRAGWGGGVHDFPRQTYAYVKITINRPQYFFVLYEVTKQVIIEGEE